MLERSQKSVAADHRIEDEEKTYVESISLTKSSPSLWGRLRHFLGSRRAMSFYGNSKNNTIQKNPHMTVHCCENIERASAPSAGDRRTGTFAAGEEAH